MPTAAKLTAALLFAALAWLVTLLIAPRLPAGTPTDLFGPVSGFIGLLVGWLLMGRRAGQGATTAIGYGLTSATAIVIWCLVVWSGWRTTVRSLRLRYDGVSEALEDMSRQAVEYGVLLWHVPTLAVLLVGAVLAGLATELVARRWS